LWDGAPLYSKESHFQVGLGTVTLGNSSPPEGNSTQKKRMTPQLPRGCPQHQKEDKSYHHSSAELKKRNGSPAS